VLRAPLQRSKTAGGVGCASRSRKRGVGRGGGAQGGLGSTPAQRAHHHPQPPSALLTASVEASNNVPSSLLRGHGGGGGFDLDLSLAGAGMGTSYGGGRCGTGTPGSSYVTHSSGGASSLPGTPAASVGTAAAWVQAGARDGGSGAVSRPHAIKTEADGPAAGEPPAAAHQVGQLARGGIGREEPK
jgi:hypothetical protein